MQLNKNKITYAKLLNRRPRLRMFSPGLWPGLLLKKPLITQRGKPKNDLAFFRQTRTFPKPFFEEQSQFQQLRIHCKLLQQRGLQRFKDKNPKRNKANQSQFPKWKSPGFQKSKKMENEPNFNESKVPQVTAAERFITLFFQKETNPNEPN